MRFVLSRSTCSCCSSSSEVVPLTLRGGAGLSGVHRSQKTAALPFHSLSRSTRTALAAHAPNELPALLQSIRGYAAACHATRPSLGLKDLLSGHSSKAKERATGADSHLANAELLRGTEQERDVDVSEGGSHSHADADGGLHSSLTPEQADLSAVEREYRSGARNVVSFADANPDLPPNFTPSPSPPETGQEGGGAGVARPVPPLHEAEATHAPPPQHRVRRFIIPGLDEMAPREKALMYYENDEGVFRPVNPKATAAAEAAQGNKKTTKEKEEELSEKRPQSATAGKEASAAPSFSSAPAAAERHAEKDGATADSEKRGGGGEGAARGGGQRQRPRAPLLSAEEEIAAKNPDVPPSHMRSRSAAPAATDAPGDASEGTPPAPDTDDLRGRLPRALVQGMTEKNKRVKKLLMAALGSEFAKAGMCSDGLRTSFSVVSYQTVKQRTGLKSIPSKLLVSCLTCPDKSIDWIDISAHPTATLTEYKEAIQEVLVNLGMHATMVDDSTEPMLLPQVTLTKECQSLLMRCALDVKGNKRMDSFQDLTNRFTLFITSKRVITVHRTQCLYVEELKKNWHSVVENQGTNVTRYLLYYFVKETVQTFMRAISQCIVEFDRYEAGLFTATRARASLAREIYHIKRRAAVYARTLTFTKDAYTHMSASLHVYPSNVHFQEVLHDLTHMESLAEELNANADSVLQLLFQLSSYQVNELMRVLTLFSAFFIPLSFIAAVYGMNFENLPFLHWDFGEVYCGILMLLVAGFIYFWFKAKHFI